MNILQKILEYKQAYFKSEFELEFELEPSKRDFKSALLQPGLGLIAEIKKKSPSKGNIFPDANVVEIAQIYEKSRASALSILTDEHFFGGSLEDLQKISESVNIPVMRKDFIWDKKQIYKARQYGADAYLLMITVMTELFSDPTKELKKLIQIGKELGMDALIETHSVKEIEIATEAGAEIIGVNSRDFVDLSIDQNIFQSLLPSIPDPIIKVAESGFQTRVDIEKIENISNAVLIGSELMKSGKENIPQKINELFS